jgi:multicomponent Na+:H+ antiporter subunit C
MDGAIVIGVGALVTASVYLFLARDLPRVLIGFALLGTAANLAILAAGRIGPATPPLVAPGATALAADAANALPQALILTAIVIGFGLAAFALMLIVKAYAAFGTIASDEMHAAERDDDDAPVEPGQGAPAPIAPDARQPRRAAEHEIA